MKTNTLQTGIFTPGSTVLIRSCASRCGKMLSIFFLATPYFPDLLFQLPVVGIEGFFLLPQLGILRLQGCHVREIGNASRFQGFHGGSIENQAAFMLCPVFRGISRLRGCRINRSCPLAGSDVLDKHHRRFFTPFRTSAACSLTAVISAILAANSVYCSILCSVRKFIVQAV